MYSRVPESWISSWFLVPVVELQIVGLVPFSVVELPIAGLVPFSVVELPIAGLVVGSLFLLWSSR